MGPGNCIDLSYGRQKIVTGKPFKQSVAPLIQRQRILFKDQLGHVAQQNHGIVEIAQASQSGLLVGGFSIHDQIGDQRFGQFGRVILGCRPQRMEQRRHGCCPARFVKGGNSGWFSRTCNLRQPLQARRRNAFWWRRTQIECADCIEPVEVMQEFAGRSLSRYGSQSVQRGKPGLAGFIEQLRNAFTLFLIESRNNTFPKTLLRSIPIGGIVALRRRGPQLRRRVVLGASLQRGRPRRPDVT